MGGWGGGQSFLLVTYCTDRIHIPIKLHEVTILWSKQECLEQINQRGITQ